MPLKFDALKLQIATTPAFVIDRNVIEAALQKLDAIRRRSGCNVLYSIKSLPFIPVLHWIKPFVDGFSVSSLFEARTAHEVLAGQGSIHLTTPGIKTSEINELDQICSHISCNSFNQLAQFSGLGTKAASLGLRLNPKLSFVADRRFDPCRQYSKLGVDIGAINSELMGGSLSGLHFHNIFAALDFDPLIQTLNAVQKQLGGRFAGLEWLNLGGGYLFDQIDDVDVFVERVRSLTTRFKLDVFVEPGKAVIGRAGYLITTVIDCFASDGKNIAVVDTSVNHHPEVFEYQLRPELHEHRADGRQACIVVGSTCLAGDIFGEYRFNEPLKIGDKLIFKNAGAYTLVKANRFNGYNFPDIYGLKNDRVALLKRYTYRDFREQWSGSEPTESKSSPTMTGDSSI